ncbi:MAG: hypothetical protein HKO01_07630 [Flaviramulus sp.]|nr:hypothetical protein [Flaviramulus sp.]NNC50388.1 hypothetical protein [Flaviramulus sp.]
MVKQFIICLVLFFFTLSINAQIDNKKKSVVIPAIESKNDSLDVAPLTPSKPINNSTIGIIRPSISPNLNSTEKEFSMFPNETFGNPGEFYEKRLKEKSQEIKDQLELGTIGSKTDLFFGNHLTKSKFVFVKYRDYGEIDGDVIRVIINNEILELYATLSGSFKSHKIELKEGTNNIDFLALSEGYLLPNTAHFKVVDDQGFTLASNLWALSVGVKASITVIKE